MKKNSFVGKQRVKIAAQLNGPHSQAVMPALPALPMTHALTLRWEVPVGGQYLYQSFERGPDLTGVIQPAVLLNCWPAQHSPGLPRLQRDVGLWAEHPQARQCLPHHPRPTASFSLTLWRHVPETHTPRAHHPSQAPSRKLTVSSLSDNLEPRQLDDRGR